MTTQKETAVTHAPINDVNMFDSATIAGETKPAICDLGKTWCDAMNERMEDLANSHTKGMTSIVLRNRLAGVAYRMSAKDPGLMLNYCPWCGESLDEDVIAHRDAKAEAANG